MAEVFLCQKGQLTPASRRELKKAGVVVVEVEDPSTCQFIRSSEVIGADDMVWACLDALNRREQYGSDGSKQREALAGNLLKIVAAARVEPSPSAALGRDRSAEGDASTEPSS